MACSTRPGPAAFCTFIEDMTGDRLTQRDWHDLRKLAEADGYPMGKKALSEDENAARIDALAASLNMQDADDVDDLKAALAGVENTEATLSVIDYMAKNGVEDTIAKVYEARGETPPSSCYDWEEGTIVLPASAVAPMKKALREHNNKFHAEVLSEAKRLVKEAGTTSPTKFAEWLKARQAARWRAEADRQARSYYGARQRSEAEELKEQAARAAEHFLESRLHGGWDRTTQTNLPAPKRVTVPTVAGLEGYGIKKMTNRDDTFEVRGGDGYEEATISFNDRKVTWSVQENNRAVERAHQAPMARVFFGELGKVKWTRGTGGTFVGNDEYNRDNYESGGGANYTTSRFGPAGDEDRIWELMRMGLSRKKASDMVKAEKASRTSSRR